MQLQHNIKKSLRRHFCSRRGTYSLPSYIRLFLLAMATKFKTSRKNSSSGYQPPPSKKTKTLQSEADRADSYKSSTQPGRVPLRHICWHPSKRGGQGILALHAHEVAKNICETGTSIRRYKEVRLVEVPEPKKESWLKEVERKIALNASLSRLQAISHSGKMYATLTCSHFVEAQKLILEGKRHYLDNTESLLFQLWDNDDEGKQIQQCGVNAIVYGPKLWDDPAALMALMREDNLDADVQKEESELDAFGLAHTVVKELVADYQAMRIPIKLSTNAVMEKLGVLGLGHLPRGDWVHLVSFRILLSDAQATFLLDCLFQVCHGRIRTPATTFGEINSIHPKAHAWPKVFLLVETYTATLLSEEQGAYRAISHSSPHATKAKTLSLHHIKELAKEVDLLDRVTNFFVRVVRHYHRTGENGANEETKMLANATLMKALGRTLWKVAEAILVVKRNRQANAKIGLAPVVVRGSDPERTNKIDMIMKDRLYKIEVRYATHLENAGVFRDGEPKPEPIEEPKKNEASESAADVPKAISHNGSNATATTVTINKRTGDVECQLTANEICKTLGLQGDGIGQAVGVRSSETLFGSGIAFSASRIILKHLNPPEAIITVTGTDYLSGTARTITKELTVDADELVPLEEQTSTEKVGPLLTGYQPHMPRTPAFDHEIGTSTSLHYALQFLTQSLACSSAKNVEEAVEVVYVPCASGTKEESGQGLFQVRAKKKKSQKAAFACTQLAALFSLRRTAPSVARWRKS